MTRANTPRISFIGFGEAGQAIASGLRESGIERIAAWDILFPQAEGAALKAAGEADGRAARYVGRRRGRRDRHGDLSGDRGLEPRGGAIGRAAPRGQPLLPRHQLGFPGRKQATAKLLDGKARYVDVAVIAPIHPKRHKTPLLIAGPYAAGIAPLLREMAMSSRSSRPRPARRRRSR